MISFFVALSTSTTLSVTAKKIVMKSPTNVKCCSQLLFKRSSTLVLDYIPIDNLRLNRKNSSLHQTSIVYLALDIVLRYNNHY